MTDHRRAVRRMVWQGWGLALVAALLLAASGVEFWREWDFGSRAVAVEAAVAGRDIDMGTTGRRWVRYRVELAFDLDEQQHSVWARVPRSRYLAMQMGDPVGIRVDPLAPQLFEWRGTLYALWGLVWAMMGMCVAVVAALSFATARRRGGGRRPEAKGGPGLPFQVCRRGAGIAGAK